MSAALAVMAAKKASSKSKSAGKRRLTDEELKTRVAIVLGLTTIGIVAWKGKGWYDKWKAARDVRRHEQYSIEGGVNLDQVSTEIYDAFFNYAYGTMEDEEAAIQSLLTVPLEKVKTVALLYNSKYGKNLYSDFRHYLSNDDYNRIKHLMQ